MVSEETKKSIIEMFEAQGMKFGKDFTDKTIEEFVGNTDDKKDTKDKD